MNLIIEKANSSDKDGIFDVLRKWNMHHIPSPEMADLDLSYCFVARSNGRVVGVGGYKMLSATEGKTTLLAIYPEFQGFGLGMQLQERRLEAMHSLGARTVTTNADRPRTIVWYKKYFGYREVGSLKKLHSFGLEDVDHWTTLRLDLGEYMNKKQQRAEEISSYIQQNDPHPLAEYAPLVINVCLTGMVPTKLSTSLVPMSVDEIIRDAIDVYDAGASIVHIHARREDGTPTPDATYYEDIIKGIRKERPDMVCCVSTSGRLWGSFEKRSEVLSLTGDAKPDMASLTLGSMNFLSGTSTNSIEMIEQLALAMKERRIKPELEVFDTGMVNVAKYLERHQLIDGKKYFNILLGNLNTASATIGSIDTIVGSLPTNSMWAVGGLGRFQLPMNVASIIAGGHVRVGIEDSIYYDYGQNRLSGNVQLVERIVRIAKELQRPIATAQQTRTMLGL